VTVRARGGIIGARRRRQTRRKYARGVNEHKRNAAAAAAFCEIAEAIIIYRAPRWITAVVVVVSTTTAFAHRRDNIINTDGRIARAVAARCLLPPFRRRNTNFLLTLFIIETRASVFLSRREF